MGEISDLRDLLQAAKSIELWVNPHKPEAENDCLGIVQHIKQIRDARPEVRDFLKMIDTQQKQRMVRVKENLGAHILRATPVHRRRYRYAAYSSATVINLPAW